MENKTLDIQNIEQAKEKINDIKVYGDGDTFALLCKASSKNQGWLKSTKVCNLPNGCLVQVSTQQGDNVAEALEFVKGIHIDTSVEPRVFKMIENKKVNIDEVTTLLNEWNKEEKENKLHMLTLENLELCFNSAKEEEYLYVGIKYEMKGFKESEISIIPLNNFAKRLEDYKNICNNDLTFKGNDNIKIVGFTMGDTFSEIQNDLVD